MPTQANLESKHLKQSLRRFTSGVREGHIIIKDYLDPEEIEEFDKLESALMKADNVPIIHNILNHLVEENISVDVDFCRTLMLKLDVLNQWENCKSLYVFMTQNGLCTHNIMMDMFYIASEREAVKFLKYVYVTACQAGMADIILHSNMIHMLEKLKDKDLANTVFKYAFNTPDAIRNNFGNTTISHNAHARMMKVAREIDDLDLARLVYTLAGDHQKQNRILHEEMIDFLVARGFNKAATLIYEKENLSVELNKDEKGLSVIDLSDKSYGTAYLGMRKILHELKGDTKFRVIPASQKTKQLLLDIESVNQQNSSSLKVDYSNSRYFNIHFSPFKLRANAQPFVMGSNQQMFPANNPNKKRNFKEIKAHSPPSPPSRRTNK
jgi:hypothetical protein